LVPADANGDSGANFDGQPCFAGRWFLVFRWYSAIRTGSLASTGASPDFLQIRHWPVERGAAFSDQDVQSAADVCIIGHTVAQNLFADKNPVGQTIRVSSLPVPP